MIIFGRRKGQKMDYASSSHKAQDICGFAASACAPLLYLFSVIPVCFGGISPDSWTYCSVWNIKQLSTLSHLLIGAIFYGKTTTKHSVVVHFGPCEREQFIFICWRFYGLLQQGSPAITLITHYSTYPWFSYFHRAWWMLSESLKLCLPILVLSIGNERNIS